MNWFSPIQERFFFFNLFTYLHLFTFVKFEIISFFVIYLFFFFKKKVLDMLIKELVVIWDLIHLKFLIYLKFDNLLFIISCKFNFFLTKKKKFRK